MAIDISQIPWIDLKVRGFVHIKGFLEEPELKLLREDHAAQLSHGLHNGNYNLVDVSWRALLRMHHRLERIARSVQTATGLSADLTVGGWYFATNTGIDFPWHQDHESYYTYQQHLNYLNFYIPILKPDPTRSNLCLVPFDRIQESLPAQSSRIIGAGAQNFYGGNPMDARDDENGDQYTLEVDFEQLKVVPELSAGDLLLMRGDMVHRTQDTQTERVAVSFRRTNSTAPISRSRFMSGCPKKREMIDKNRGAYQSLFDCFAALNRDEITARDLVSFVMNGDAAAVRRP